MYYLTILILFHCSLPCGCTLYSTCNRRFYVYTWSVQKYANFEFPQVKIRFSIFMALCWYSYPSLMATSSVMLNVQLIFDSYFSWACFDSSSIFVSSVSGTRKSHRGQDLGNTVAAANYCVVLAKNSRTSNDV